MGDSPSTRTCDSCTAHVNELFTKEQCGHSLCANCSAPYTSDETRPDVIARNTRKGNRDERDRAAANAECIACNRCPICLDTIANRTTLDSCAHIFCFSCISTVASTVNECPVCRKTFRWLTDVSQTRHQVADVDKRKDDSIRYHLDEENAEEVVGVFLDRILGEEGIRNALAHPVATALLDRLYDERNNQSDSDDESFDSKSSSSSLDDDDDESLTRSSCSSEGSDWSDYDGDDDDNLSDPFDSDSFESLSSSSSVDDDDDDDDKPIVSKKAPRYHRPIRACTRPIIVQVKILPRSNNKRSSTRSPPRAQKRTPPRRGGSLKKTRKNPK